MFSQEHQASYVAAERVNICSNPDVLDELDEFKGAAHRNNYSGIIRKKKI